MAGLGSLEDTVPQTTLMDLPPELVSRILYFAMKTDKTIPYVSAEERQSQQRLIDVGLHGILPEPLPTTSLAGISSLQEIAEAELYQANTFRAHLGGEYIRHQNCKRFYGYAIYPHPGSLELVDNASLRPHIRNLEIEAYVQDAGDLDEEPMDVSLYTEVIKQLPGMYPKLRLLTVSVHFNLCGWWHEDDHRPLETIIGERLEWMKRMVQAVRDLPGIREKNVDLKHGCDTGRSILEQPFDPMEIDGRGREVGELCWEMLDYEHSKVRV